MLKQILFNLRPKVIMKGLSKTFIITYISTCIIIFYLSYLYIGNLSSIESIMGVIAALFGISYALFAGKGKMICFIFGICYSSIYAYIAYNVGLYGDCMLNLLYIPINIAGIILWSSNKNIDDSKIIIRHVKVYNMIIYTMFIIAASIIYGMYLKKINSIFPYLNAFLVVSQLIAFYMQIRRYVESFTIVTICNICYIFMWKNIVFNADNILKNEVYTISNISQLLTFIIFLIIGIVYWIEWYKAAK